jgi:photosystem II stability/assembly factor-like uncharacterized protein
MNRRVYLGLLLLASLLGVSKVFAYEADRLYSLVLDPKSNTLFMGTSNGLHESSDNGKTWRKRTLKGDLKGTDFMTMALDPNNTKILYAGGHDLGVVKSEDGGMSWRPAGKGLPPTTMDIQALAIDPTRPKRLHAWAVGYGVYRSNNMAESWFLVDDGPESRRVTSLTSAPIPHGMGDIFLYAGTAAGLFRSPDCF